MAYTSRNLRTCLYFFFFFQAEDGIRDKLVTGVQTCALPISRVARSAWRAKVPTLSTQPPLAREILLTLGACTSTSSRYPRGHLTLHLSMTSTPPLVTDTRV